MSFPEPFSEMQSDEKIKYYYNQKLDYCFIDRAREAVISIVLREIELKNDEVEIRINDYRQYYSRLAPGFIMGEMAIRKEELFNVGVLTFQSNAQARNLLNVFAVMNYQDKELTFMLSGNIKDSIELLPEYITILDSLKQK